MYMMYVYHRCMIHAAMAGLEQRVGLYQASHEKLGGLTAELLAERSVCLLCLPYIDKAALYVDVGALRAPTAVAKLTAELDESRARVDALKERVAALGAEAAAAREEAAEHTRLIAELEAQDAAVDALRADLRSAA